MRAHDTTQHVRERYAVNSLLSVGVLLVFVLTFILALQSAGLFVTVWRAAHEKFSVDASNPPTLAKPLSTSLNCEFQLPAVLSGAKGKSGSSSPISGVCKPDITDAKDKTPEQPSTADTLSALGVVVALVTLLLTLGSTYLSQKQREIDKLLDKEKQRQSMEECLILVQRDCFAYFMSKQPRVGAQQTLECSIYLRGLQSSKADIRKSMSDKVSNLIGASNINELPQVRVYVSELERYLHQYVMAPGEETYVKFIR